MQWRERAVLFWPGPNGEYRLGRRLKWRFFSEDLYEKNWLDVFNVGDRRDRGRPNFRQGVIRRGTGEAWNRIRRRPWSIGRGGSDRRLRRREELAEGHKHFARK